MNYLRSFIAEKTRAHTSQGATDKTDKTPEGELVSSVSDSSGLKNTCPFTSRPVPEKTCERDRYHRAVALACAAASVHRDLLDHVRQHAPELLHDTRSEATPAVSILTTCTRYGITLRIAIDGSLLVGKASTGPHDSGWAWPSLLMAIEAHAGAIAALLAAGWHLQADFPKDVVA
jgi:hypothetical protein